MKRRENRTRGLGGPAAGLLKRRAEVDGQRLIQRGGRLRPFEAGGDPLIRDTVTVKEPCCWFTYILEALTTSSLALVQWTPRPRCAVGVATALVEWTPRPRSAGAALQRLDLDGRATA